MKVAILGGGGCFAINFANHLHERGIEHIGIGRSRKAAPFWLVNHEYRFWALHLVDDLARTLAVLDAFRPSVIVNFAAQGEGAASFANAADFYRTNTWGLVALAEELRQRDYLRRFIQIGTSELYGSVNEPASESAPLRPSSPYAVSKAAFDEHLGIMHRIHGFPVNIVRPSNAYTPGQQLYRIIPKTILCALAGRKLPLHGGGVAQKSYIHASDLSEALLAVIEKAPAGATYNVGPDTPTSIRAVVEMTLAACGASWDVIEETPDRVGQDGKYWLDSSAIKALGWRMKIGLNGLEGMVKWVREFPQLCTMDTRYEHRP